MSAAIAAAVAGARTMTATSSQGLALMAEVVYIAASMRAPVVMALGNRALSGPINIHCDHSDSMLIRDSGAIQLFAESAQEAYDLTVLAPRLAEHPDVLLPVLVCVDGFTITHSAEPVAAARRRAGARLRRRVPHPAPAPRPRQPDHAGPVRDARLLLRAAPPAGGRDRGIARRSSRSSAASSALLTGRTDRRRRARTALEDAERVLVCLGSTAGTAKDVVDELRDEGEAVGLLRICSFRPFPAAEVRDALGGRRTRSSCSTAPTRRAASPPLAVEVAYAVGRPGPQPRLRPRRPRPPPGRPPRGVRGQPPPGLRRTEERVMSRLKTLVRERARHPAAPRRPLALPGLRDPDGRAHGRSTRSRARRSSSTRPAASRSRPRASRPPPGTCPGCTSRSRTRPPVRAASRPPTGRSAGAAGCRRTTS